MQEGQKTGESVRRDTWRKRVAALGGGLTPLTLLGVGLVLVAQVRASDELRAREIAAQDQRALLISTLSAHQDIETGTRGYVITGDDTFLEPAVHGEDVLKRTLPALQQFYEGRPDETPIVNRLLALSAQKRAYSAQSVALRRKSGFEQAAERMSIGRGKQLMDEIRVELALLQARQEGHIAEVTAKSQQAIVVLQALLFGLLLVLLVLLGLAWRALRRTIEARDHALVELQDLSQRRKAILEGAMDGIMTLNPSGSIESSNPAMQRLVGYSEEELDRRDVGMLLAERPRIGETAEALKGLQLPEGHVGESRQIEALRKDGSTFSAEVALSRVQLTEGLRYVAMVRDITERKRIEQLKSEFVSTVSHELRTPLTSIAGSLGLLSAGAQDILDNRSARLIEIAHGNAKRLVRLINDILDIEKMESGRMPFHNQRINLSVARASALEAISGYAQEYAVTMKIETSGGEAWVEADRDRLAQVFDNLLSNAVKFSPRGSTVRIGIASEGGWHTISVSDEGPGIPEAFQDRIFSKFAQADATDSRQKGGTGLGLSIVREIVRRLGGEIDFVTGPDIGTTFRVRLPAVAAAAGTYADGTPTLLVCGNGAASTFTEALRAAGYAVRLVRTLTETQEAVAAQVYAGIVVDMGLRDGAGVAAIRAIRDSTINSQTPVLALGGRPGASELDGDAALVLDWLHKPGEVERLIDRIDQVSEGRTGALPRMLHVEDDPDVVLLVRTALEGRAQVVATPSVARARALLTQESFDLAVIDLTLADGSGIELLPDLRRALGPPVPVVIFSAQDADPATAQLVDAYLTKARTPISALVAIVSSLTGSAIPQEFPR